MLRLKPERAGCSPDVQSNQQTTPSCFDRPVGTSCTCHRGTPLCAYKTSIRTDGGNLTNMSHHDGTFVRHSHARRAAEPGTRKQQTGTARKVIRTLFFVLLFSGLSYAFSQYQIPGLKDYPGAQYVLAAVIEETLRRCENKLTR